MKKALLLVLVLAFLLVPVFSSAVSAAGVADWVIGDGMVNREGSQTKLELEATEEGLVITHTEGTFATDKNNMGIWAKEGWDLEEMDEISITLSLNEYVNYALNNMTQKYEDMDAWFKFTLMSQPDSLTFANTDGIKGLAFSIVQDTYSWGSKDAPRLRVWVESVAANFNYVDDDNDESTPAVQDGYKFDGFGAVPGSVWGSWEGELLNEDVTIKLTRKPNPGYRGDQNIWSITAEVGGDEQILAANYNIADEIAWPDPNAKLYPGFIANNAVTNIDPELVGPMVYEEATEEIRIKDAIYVEGELSLNLGDYKAADASITGLAALDDREAPEDAAYTIEEVDGVMVRKDADGKVTHVYAIFAKNAGDTAQDENWGEIADPDGAPKYTLPEQSIKATVKWLNGEWLGTGEAPSTATVAPTAAPTETPDIDQTGQDFTLAIVLGSMAAMLAIAGAVVMVNKSRA